MPEMSPDRLKLVGLDFGQTRVKAVVMDAETGDIDQVLASAAPKREATCRVGGRNYQGLTDPEQLVSMGCRLVREALAAVRGPVALAVSSAGPPLVAVDRAGQAVWPVIGHWPGVPDEERLEALPYDPADFYTEAGSPLWYLPPVFHLAWLTRHDPERADQVARVLSVGGYVVARLSGIAIAEPSTAGATGALDRRTRTWSPTILAAGHLNVDWFPPLVRAGTVVGETSQLRDEGPPVSIAVGGHDYLTAALAAGAMDEQVRVNIMGTWEMAAHFTAIGPSGGWGGTEPHPVLHDLHVLPGLGTSTLECWGGGQIEWARRLLGMDVREFFVAASEAVPQAPRGRWYAPFLGRQFFPLAGHGRDGAGFGGLDPSVGSGDLARMVLEGIGYLGARMFELLETGQGFVPPRLVIAGGASRYRLVGELKADLLNRVVYVHQTPDLSAAGAALLAGVGAGSYRTAEEAATLLRDRVTQIEPDPTRHRAYRDCFDALGWV